MTLPQPSFLFGGAAWACLHSFRRHLPPLDAALHHGGSAVSLQRVSRTHLVRQRVLLCAALAVLEISVEFFVQLKFAVTLSTRLNTVCTGLLSFSAYSK